MGNTSSSPNIKGLKRQRKTKDQWEKKLFNRRNVKIPMAWKELKIPVNEKLSITEYVWLTKHSVSSNLWDGYMESFQWARILNNEIATMKKNGLHPFSNKWDTPAAKFEDFYPCTTDGLSALVHRFLKDVGNKRSIKKYLLDRKDSDSYTSSLKWFNNNCLVDTSTKWKYHLHHRNSYWSGNIIVTTNQDNIIHLLFIIKQINMKGKIFIVMTTTQPPTKQEITSIINDK